MIFFRVSFANLCFCVVHVRGDIKTFVDNNYEIFSDNASSENL